MVNLMKAENDYDSANRWMFLYENGKTKQIQRRELDRKIKQIKEGDDLMNYTFRPSINQRPTKDEDDVVQRTNQWALDQRTKKKEKI